MDEASSSRSYLFTVRVWEEDMTADRTEWRGKVQLFLNGEVRYFRNWTDLAPLLITMLSESQTDVPPEGKQGDFL